MVTRIHLFNHAVETVEFKAGDTIFVKGDRGDFMYVIQQGEVEIRYEDRLLETLDADQVFGEMALITREPRMATAVARTDCKLIPIDARRFLFMIDNNRTFALDIMRILCSRLVMMDERISS